jgi:hypothetical protein
MAVAASSGGFSCLPVRVGGLGKHAVCARPKHLISYADSLVCRTIDSRSKMAASIMIGRA